MNKLLAFLLTVALATSAVSCGKNHDDNDRNPKENNKESEVTDVKGKNEPKSDTL